MMSANIYGSENVHVYLSDTKHEKAESDFLCARHLIRSTCREAAMRFFLLLLNRTQRYNDIWKKKV